MINVDQGIGGEGMRVRGRREINIYIPCWPFGGIAGGKGGGAIHTLPHPLLMRYSPIYFQTCHYPFLLGIKAPNTHVYSFYLQEIISEVQWMLANITPIRVEEK